MIVKELINKLLALDSDTEIFIYNSGELLEIKDLDILENDYIIIGE